MAIITRVDGKVYLVFICLQFVVIERLTKHNVHMKHTTNLVKIRQHDFSAKRMLWDLNETVCLDISSVVQI